MYKLVQSFMTHSFSLPFYFPLACVANADRARLLSLIPAGETFSVIKKLEQAGLVALTES